MGQYRLTINREGHKAGAIVELEADDALVLGGFAVPVSASKKAAPAPAPEPVVEEAAEEAAEETEDKSSSRRRRSSSDE